MFLNDFTTVCTWQGLTYWISGSRFHVVGSTKVVSCIFTLYLPTYKNTEYNTVAAKCFEGEQSIARPGDQELDRTSILCYTVCIRETMWEKRDLNIFFLFGLLYVLYIWWPNLLYRYKGNLNFKIQNEFKKNQNKYFQHIHITD